MGKTLVMYFTKYGTTKKYAEWIAEELNGDILDIKNASKEYLLNYDIIILGNGLYAGKINGINILIENYEILKNKKLVIFTCGLADYSKDKNINEIKSRIEKEIPKNIMQDIKVFYLRGGIDYKKLNLKHKIMMWLLKMKVKNNKSDKLEDEDKVFLETYGKTIDFTDKKNLIELLEYCTQTYIVVQ